jgi:hypothetical protein
MTFWNGSHWVDETPASSSPTKPSRLHNWAVTGLMVLSLTAIALPLHLVAAASHHSGNSGCAVNPANADVGEVYVVSAWGIPAGAAVNIWVTDPNNVTVGRPLGTTLDGTFALNESSAFAGPWTYAFSGPVKNHTTMYGTCSVDAY